MLAEILSRSCRLPVKFADNDEEIRSGQVYVARPNLHLTIRRGRVENRFLPRENMTRPAIDPMFRSAAQAYGRRVIGVLMTGTLDDGTAGLGIIKDEGGLAVVQDPDDCLYPDMPSAAIQRVVVDHVVPLAGLGPLIVNLVNSGIEEAGTMKQNQPSEADQVFTCPGCGGVIRKYSNGQVAWYQCQVGHRYSLESMVSAQDAEIEERLWGAMALLKQKEDLARAAAEEARSSSRQGLSAEFLEKQAELAAEAENLINALLSEKGPILFPPAEDLKKVPKEPTEK